MWRRFHSFYNSVWNYKVKNRTGLFIMEVSFVAIKNCIDMATIGVHVYKDDSGFHADGYAKAISEPITVYDIVSIPLYAEDMIGCQSDEYPESMNLLQIYTPDTGIIYVNETRDSIYAKIAGECCAGGGGSGSNAGILNIILHRTSATYQNDALIGANTNIVVLLGGVQIFPTFDPITGTLDNTSGGGFTATNLSVIYTTGSGGSGGTGGSGVFQVTSGMLDVTGKILTNAAFTGKTINAIATDASGLLFGFTQVDNVITFSSATLTAGDNLVYFY